MGYKMVDSKLAHSILPDEYQEVEYLESTGTQYIDTETFINNLTDEILLEISYNPNQTPYAYSGSYVQNRTTQLGLTADGNKCRTTMNMSFENPVTKYGLETNAFHKLLMRSGLQTVDDEIVGTFQSLNNGNDYHFFLFRRNNNGVLDTNVPGIHSIKRFYIKRNNQLIRNMIPCYRKSDNKPGMYDLVNNAFYTNQGTGEFITGPKLFNTTKYQLMDGESNKAYKIGG